MNNHQNDEKEIKLKWQSIIKQLIRKKLIVRTKVSKKRINNR